VKHSLIDWLLARWKVIFRDRRVFLFRNGACWTTPHVDGWATRGTDEMDLVMGGGIVLSVSPTRTVRLRSGELVVVPDVWRILRECRCGSSLGVPTHCDICAGRQLARHELS
jgi:hypothetical protein